MSPLINKKADWDNLWREGFDYGPIDSWSSQLFLAIADLLQSTSNPRILSAGCGRGVIDYWLAQVFGYHVTFLDSSKQCIMNLKSSLHDLPKDRYELSHASIFNIPYPDKSFDVVWNEGVLEHFTSDEFNRAIKEMKRVSRKYVVIDVPNANSKPYVLAKEWLESHNLWGYGYELPRKSLKADFRAQGIKVIYEKSIGTVNTLNNYIAMIPEDHRHEITNKLTKKDFTTFPHLLTVGTV